WYQELLPSEEVTFDADVYLLLKARAKALKKGGEADTAKAGGDEKASQPLVEEFQPSKTTASSESSHRTICLSGAIPSEVWNRLGTKLIPKLKTGANLQIGLTFKIDVEYQTAPSMEKDIKQVLDDLGLTDKIRIDVRKRD
ncbi:MAG: hypothetical protein ACREJU_17040, partial [Nitrospiraceae bacterium]